MPTLVLIRHSKAEPPRTDDHARELAPRGRSDARLVREWLLAHAIEPDRVVVSSAVRTKQTWEGCSVGSVAPEFEDRVYEASVEDLREVIVCTEALVGTLVLVGHNPSVERLAWELDDSDAARDQTSSGMRTSGVAVFEVSGWDLAQARLTDFH